MDALQQTAAIISEHMDAIVACFKPGVKITVLVRVPEHPDRDFLMTDDDIDEVIAMAQRRKAAGMN